MTRYALPVTTFDGLSSPVAEHFGRSDTFVVLETDGDQTIFVSVLHPKPTPEADEEHLADFLYRHGIDVVLAGEIGPCMTTPLIDKGIQVYKGATGTVKEAYDKYNVGELTEVQKSRYSL